MGGIHTIMFIGMNARIDEHLINYADFYETGLEFFKEQKRLVHKQLCTYIREDNLIDASALEEDWFPSIDANVFISNSHRDQNFAVAFAGWLYKIFGITSFIDSCVWGYSDDMLKMIDEEYCVSKRKSDGSVESYSYKKRNQSTSHVHMILNTALHKMIDKTECLIFLNTPNSLIIDDVINGTATASPWIYSELMFSRMCCKRKLSEYRQSFQHGAIFEHTDLKVKYEVKVDHLVDIDNQNLIEMWKYCSQKDPITALDEFYENLGIISKRRTLNGQ